MSERSPLAFGLVGCGTIAPTHADALRSLPQAALVACCDTNAAKARAFAERYHISAEHVHNSLESFLADEAIQAVTVCTPSGLHAEVGIASLRSGRPVIVEKPMDVSLAACDRLLAAQRDTGLTLGVISQRRFEDAFQYARNALDEGRFGPVILIDAQVKWYRTQEYYDSGEWRGTWALDGGGALMNQGVHTVDIVRWLAGPVESVYAVAKTAAHERIEVEDIICATLRFKSGAVGNLVATTAAYPGLPATIELYGKEGSLLTSGDALKEAHFLTGRDDKLPASGSEAARIHALQVAQGGTRSATAAKDTAPPPADRAWEWGAAHRAQLADFIDAAHEKRKPAVDGSDGRSALELVLAIYESARTGEVVHL
ncbi:MAG TPA: Gfo/Idh/MocA family oxidoreductase [Capsulimonadaceae bacterium]|nr:Gfo/Idh/MocA family oxidoreductase [Capsulimonadaceae bacterium]